MSPKLGHILLVAINRQPPPSIGIIDNLHMDALDDEVGSVARQVEILRITPKDDWGI